jgi:HEPN domain-containing protein
MNKTEYIKYWITSAEEDFATMNFLFKGKRYVHALFFGHLYIEKICKALWVKTNKENFPPKIHNLLTLINQTNISLTDADKMFLLKLNQYQIEGRYPEDIQKLYKITNKKLTQEYITTIKTISLCLLKDLQLQKQNNF